MAEDHHHTDDLVDVSERGCHDEHNHDEHHHREDDHRHDHDHHHGDDGDTHVGSEEVLVSEFKQVTVNPEKHEQKEDRHHGLLEKLQRSHSSSSSSSSDEEDDSDEKKKKEKKGLKETIKEKICGDQGDQKPAPEGEVVAVTAEAKTEEAVQVVEVAEEQQQHPPKKGFLEKIKEKLPGVHSAPAPPPAVTSDVAVDGRTEECISPAKEKKGFLEKIKEKLPGYHPKSGGEETTSH